MISKPVPANSFYHTCRYIANKPGAELLIAEGVRGHDHKLMAADFEMQQHLRPSKKLACFHSILSFYPGEKPSDEMMKDIARKYLEGLGITNTQYAVSKHTDKAHPHLHIVANMVNNDGKAISDSWIGLRGKKIAQRLTEEYKLTPALKKNLELTNIEALSEAEAGKYKVYIAIAENLPHCKTMEDLEQRLLSLGILTQYKYKAQTQEKQGISFKLGNVCYKGSQVDRKFSFASLQKSLELNQQKALQQKQTGEPRLTKSKIPNQNQTDSESGSTSIDQETRKEQRYDLAAALGKALDILLKPEQADEQTPITDEQQRKRRKKRRGLGY